jgi:hypothetical protein
VDWWQAEFCIYVYALFEINQHKHFLTWFIQILWTSSFSRSCLYELCPLPHIPDHISHNPAVDWYPVDATRTLLPVWQSEHGEWSRRPRTSLNPAVVRSALLKYNFIQVKELMLSSIKGLGNAVALNKLYDFVENLHYAENLNWF